MKIKTIKDYYEIMYSKFPDVPKEDIKRILNYGWKSLYLHNSYGGDTFIQGNGLWCYIGNLKKTALEHFHYYIKKLTIRLRVLYNKRKTKWDGFYYFALQENQYQEYLSQINKKGRPKKYFTFNKIVLYKLLDECKIKEYSGKYIFRIPYLSELSYRIFLDTLKTDKAELIITREPLKFKDILTYSNKYDIL